MEASTQLGGGHGSTATRFKPLPPRDAKWINWSEVDRELRANPGNWALVATKKTARDATALVSKLRHGQSQPGGKPRVEHLEIGAFEIERRGCEVYARYVGAA